MKVNQTFPVALSSSSLLYPSMFSNLNQKVYAQNIDPRLRFNASTGTLTVNQIQLPRRLFNTFAPRSSITYIPDSSIQAFVASATRNVEGFRASIAPSSIESKIFISVRIYGEYGNDTALWNTMWGLKRNGSMIGNPTNFADIGTRNYGITTGAIGYYAADNNSTPEGMHFCFLDEPATTSAVEYQLTLYSANSFSIYFNRTVADTDSGGYERGTSCIVLMEVC